MKFALIDEANKDFPSTVCARRSASPRAATLPGGVDRRAAASAII